MLTLYSAVTLHRHFYEPLAHGTVTWHTRSCKFLTRPSFYNCCVRGCNGIYECLPHCMCITLLQMWIILIIVILVIITIIIGEFCLYFTFTFGRLVSITRGRGSMDNVPHIFSFIF